MNNHHNFEMRGVAPLAWSSQTTANMAGVAEEDLGAEVDEPPDNRIVYQQHPTDFCRSPIPSQPERKESLLTKALLSSPEAEPSKPEIHTTRSIPRRRSITSNFSLASTAELTSDGGLTSPSRTNTPSPPIPAITFSNIPPLSLAQKKSGPPVADITTTEPAIVGANDVISVSAKAGQPLEAAPRKRCITFACGGQKATAKPAQPSQATAGAPKRPCAIKFACPAKPAEKSVKSEVTNNIAVSPTEIKMPTPRSPSTLKKIRLPSTPSPRSHRDSASTVKRPSPKPDAQAKPKYLVADEEALASSEATRFHEFAREEVRDDDWIQKDEEEPKARLTINDTLKVENAIRKLGDEAEEEALDEEKDEEADEEDLEGYASDDEGDFLNEEDGYDLDSEDSNDDASDGNETDNEAGFAESDDESDPEGHFAFWTPGKFNPGSQNDAGYRPSAHRKVSTSSIDSNHPIGLPHIRIRPRTPDLPDSTDFVCGTLDEDRPLEDAYMSCIEARKVAKHRAIPQDIDPSFPTSEPEDEEDEPVEAAKDSDENVWLHGKFEDSDEERRSRRRSPVLSPKRFASPPPKRCRSPPPKLGLRSPPPRKLFGHSPKRTRSPLSGIIVHSPAPSVSTSPNQAKSSAMSFTPLASRPGLTHTKSLPRTPAAFGRHYRASRLGPNGTVLPGKDADGHIRGAIDIVKGLEQKRQHRKEKYYRARRAQPKKSIQPGKGAERMREVGLLMAGKGGTQNYMLSL